MTIQLTWDLHDDVETPAGYQIGYDKGATPSLIAALPHPYHELTVELDLDAGMLYRFWVKEYDKAGNLSTKQYIAHAIQHRG